MLCIDGVCKTFPGQAGREQVEVLRDIRFDVAAGEFVSIIGPSGCGKTTLLRIIHGLEPATRGEVLLAEQRTVSPSSASAMVFQHFNLFPWLTVADNIAFGLQVARLPHAVIEARTDQWLRIVGLDGFSAHYPHEISGGMRQRVGLARALALDPSVLLCDEPFGALDAITREHLQAEIGAILSRSPKTVVFVTHNMDEAILFSDRILVLSARPARVIDEVRVDFQRPRDASTVRAQPRFTSIRERLWSLLAQGDLP